MNVLLFYAARSDLFVSLNIFCYLFEERYVYVKVAINNNKKGKTEDSKRRVLLLVWTS